MTETVRERRQRFGSRLIRAVIVTTFGAALAAVALTGAQSASAHDFLVSTSPAADSTVSEALSEVALTFNEPPLADLSAAIAIEVHDPSGANVADGTVSIVNSTLSTTVVPTSTGRYTVLWQTISADGHPVSGEFGFDYTGPVGEAAAGSPTAGAGSPTAEPGTGATTTAPGNTGADTPAATPTPSPTSDTGGSPSADGSGGAGSGGLQPPLVLVGVGAALVALAVVAIVVVVLRRRTPAE
jgi:methionine-rich copper-binding protein CopC